MDDRRKLVQPIERDRELIEARNRLFGLRAAPNPYQDLAGQFPERVAALAEHLRRDEVAAA